MLPFGVTIPATVPQGSEIPEGLKNNPVCVCVYIYIVGARGGVVVKALRYKPEGRRFDSRWCHWNLSVT
jgi:hypothetical protein